MIAAPSLPAIDFIDLEAQRRHTGQRMGEAIVKSQTNGTASATRLVSA
ncbi:hypothetical protein [Phreatobacter sp.]|nr:hypothetical protein [Phreatobacter sp.]MCZ8316889.1 hypothetical protein [Phreatobacter sp.]